jgi:hypothetical protein
MSNKNDDDIFWELVEAFIEQANDACENVDPGIVSAALMNATARFNAFVVAHSSLDKNEFAEDIEGTTNYLSGRYRDFLKEHMEDYRESYTTLIGNRELPDNE